MTIERADYDKVLKAALTSEELEIYYPLELADALQETLTRGCLPNSYTQKKWQAAEGKLQRRIGPGVLWFKRDVDAFIKKHEDVPKHKTQFAIIRSGLGISSADWVDYILSKYPSFKSEFPEIGLLDFFFDVEISEEDFLPLGLADDVVSSEAKKAIQELDLASQFMSERGYQKSEPAGKARGKK